MRQRLSAPAALVLRFGNRLPELVDDMRRIARDVSERTLQMFGPEAETRLADERRVAGDDVELRVVEQGVFVQVGRAERQPPVVDDADLGVDVDRRRAE